MIIFAFVFHVLIILGMEDHHMAGAPGIYSGRSTSSSSSPGVAGSSPALLVVPQPINATKMGGMQNGGPQPRKYQCKMCPQVSVFNIIIIKFFDDLVALFYNASVTRAALCAKESRFNFGYFTFKF